MNERAQHLKRVESAAPFPPLPIPSRAPLPRQHPILRLQHTAGNQAAQRVIQAKLIVGPVGDAYEREADRLAEQAVTPQTTSRLQRKCSCGGTPGPDGECAECRKKRLALQRRPAGGAPAPVSAPAIVDEVLRSSGQPLEPATQAFMSSRLGHDFGPVRVHTGAQAARSAEAVGALAYTVGNDIVFNTGQYAPGTTEGSRLIAHELVHTMQQGDAGASPARELSSGSQPGGTLQRVCSQHADEAFYRAAPNYCKDTGFSGVLHPGNQCYRELPRRSGYFDCPPGDQVCFDKDGKCEDSYDKASTVEKKNDDGTCNLHGYCFLHHAALDILPSIFSAGAEQNAACLVSCDKLEGTKKAMCMIGCEQDAR